MNSLLNSCLEHTFGNEGGYYNHPNDKGGPTKYGIAFNFNVERLAARGITSPDQMKDLSIDFSGRQEKISRKLRNYVYPQLKENPHFGNNIKKMRNYSPETWRYRIGEYRFFYQIDEQEKIVFMIAADHRKQSYR